MKYCSNCGSEVDEKAVVCLKCGFSLKKKRNPILIIFFTCVILVILYFLIIPVITYGIMNKGGKSNTIITDPYSPYLEKGLESDVYIQVGYVTTKTKDGASVSVDMIIVYDKDDQNTAKGLFANQYELHDFVRYYFTGKISKELVHEKEEELKNDIIKQINTRFSNNAKVKEILFNKLDVMEMF